MEERHSGAAIVFFMVQATLNDIGNLQANPVVLLADLGRLTEAMLASTDLIFDVQPNLYYRAGDLGILQ